MVGGLSFAFAGYTLYKIGVWLVGFVGGLLVGLAVSPGIELALLGSVSAVSLLLAGLVGLLGGWLALILEWLLVLGGGFAIGDLLVALLFGVDPFGPVAALGGIVVAILALKLYVWAIILVTAFLGSWLVTLSTLGPSVGGIGRPFLTFLVVFLVGVIVQSGLYRLGISPLGSGSSSDGPPTRSGPPRRHRCPECGHLNGRNRPSCFACGSPL